MANEKRLIYANVAIEKCNKLLDNACSCPNTAALIGVKIVRDQILSECTTGCHTVDAVEVVHGHWIPIEYDGYADGNPVWDLWECSECQEEHSGDEDTLTPYCPYCGAKMDGDGND